MLWNQEGKMVIYWNNSAASSDGRKIKSGAFCKTVCGRFTFSQQLMALKQPKHKIPKDTLKARKNRRFVSGRLGCTSIFTFMLPTL